MYTEFSATLLHMSQAEVGQLAITSSAQIVGRRDSGVCVIKSFHGLPSGTH